MSQLIELSILFYDIQNAHAIAARICLRLRPHGRVINIAVSKRRKAKQVKDIEIICLPVRIAGPQKTLFDENDRYNVLSSDFENIINNLGKPIKGKPDGKYMQIELPEAIHLDLFTPDDFDYYRQPALRTGSAEYSVKVLANAWRKKGWCGSDKGLRRTIDCVEIR